MMLPRLNLQRSTKVRPADSVETTTATRMTISLKVVNLMFQSNDVINLSFRASFECQTKYIHNFSMMFEKINKSFSGPATWKVSTPTESCEDVTLPPGDQCDQVCDKVFEAIFFTIKKKKRLNVLFQFI